MIHIFRKEMKKWHTVLWVVVASLALSSITVFVFRPKNLTERAVATVGGEPVSFERYRLALNDVQERINSMKQLARAYGMSEELFITTFLGNVKPEDKAIEISIDEVLLDKIKNQLGLIVDDEWFKQELIKSMPQLVDQSGHINMEAYQGYLHHMSITPAQFESHKKEEMSRGLITDFVFNARYLPGFAAQDLFESNMMEKSFTFVKFPFQHFLDLVKKEGASAEALEAYYRENKETYRVPEKRKAQYWEFSGAEYAKKAVVTVELSAVHEFYEHHKGTMFRIAPKIKVRRIVFALKDYETAKKMYDQIKEKKASFEAIAQQYSTDKKTAAAGGLVDFFARGAHDPEFERIAFRLHNIDELSPLTKTKQGYEVVQLVERIGATEKPFDAVKDEIEKTLKTRKSLSAARNDLATLMRSIKENDKALEQFAKDHQLQEQQTGYLTEDDTKGDEIVNQVARRLFSTDKRQNVVGYLNNKDMYVVYKLVDQQKSYIPTLDQIKDTVTNDYYRNKAEDKAKKILKELKLGLLDKKMTLQDIASTYGVSLVTTKKCKKSDQLAELGKHKNLQALFFSLSDPAQVLQIRQADDYYLAQLHEQSSEKEGKMDQETMKIIDQEKYKVGTMQVSAFIASLRRNAKIEIDQKVLKARHIDYER